VSRFQTSLKKDGVETVNPAALAAYLNNRINSDWQFRCAPLPAGYAERYVVSFNGHFLISSHAGLPKA